MLRVRDDLLGVADLDDPPEVHHGDAVTDHPGEGEVVGDEDVGDPELLLLLDHELEDVVADRDVEARDRLVGDDHVGVEHRGAGDADPLPLPAGELMRVAVEVLLRRPQTRLVDRPDDALLLLALGRHKAVDLERFGDDVEDRLLGVDRVVGVLEDDLCLLAVLPQRLLAEALDGQLLVVDVAPRRVLETQHGAAGRRLAAARLADQGEDLALAHVERDVVDGLDVLLLGSDQRLDEALVDREVDLKVSDLEEHAVGDVGRGEVLGRDAPAGVGGAGLGGRAPVERAAAHRDLSVGGRRRSRELLVAGHRHVASLNR